MDNDQKLILNENRNTKILFFTFWWLFIKIWPSVTSFDSLYKNIVLESVYMRAVLTLHPFSSCSSYNLSELNLDSYC